MSKMQAAVREVAIGSLIKSPLFQKFSLKSKNSHKNNYKNSKKAFSVAEATIALLIGSVALGMAAPMITKQIKSNNMADTQSRVLTQRINNIVEDNEEFKTEIQEIIREEINNLRNEKEEIPSGMVAFFNTKTCPEGWVAINANWNGRFPRFSGNYTVLSYNTSTRNYNKTGTAQTLSVGATQEDAIRNIIGTTFGEQGGYVDSSVSGAFYLGAEKSARGIASVDSDNKKMYFSAIRVVPTAVENRPRSVALLGCVKK